MAKNTEICKSCVPLDSRKRHNYRRRASKIPTQLTLTLLKNGLFDFRKKNSMENMYGVIEIHRCNYFHRQSSFTIYHRNNMERLAYLWHIFIPEKSKTCHYLQM